MTRRTARTGRTVGEGQEGCTYLCGEVVHDEMGVGL